MNTIAMQIDYATEELRLMNDVLEARQKCRTLENAVNDTKPGTDRLIANMRYTDALAKVIRLEREYKDMFAPADYVAPVVKAEPLPDCDFDCGETFRSVKRQSGMHPDDPRRGQSSGINSMIRRPE